MQLFPKCWQLFGRLFDTHIFPIVKRSSLSVGRSVVWMRRLVAEANVPIELAHRTVVGRTNKRESDLEWYFCGARVDMREYLVHRVQLPSIKWYLSRLLDVHLSPADWLVVRFGRHQGECVEIVAFCAGSGRDLRGESDSCTAPCTVH